MYCSTQNIIEVEEVCLLEVALLALQKTVIVVLFVQVVTKVVADVQLLCFYCDTWVCGTGGSSDLFWYWLVGAQIQVRRAAEAKALLLTAQRQVGLGRRNAADKVCQRFCSDNTTPHSCPPSLVWLTQWRLALCSICSRHRSRSRSSSLCCCSRLACSSAMRFRRWFLSSRQSVYSSCRLSRLRRAWSKWKTDAFVHFYKNIWQVDKSSWKQS